MATTSNASEGVAEVDCLVSHQQLQSNFVELQKADSGVVQLGIKSDFNESSTVEIIDNFPIGTSHGIQYSGEDHVVYNLIKNDGCSITPPRGPGCKSGCSLCPYSFKADGGVDIEVDEGYPCLHEKLKKVFNNMKIWLTGCSSAERVMQSHLDKLEDGEAASDMLRRRVESLAASLSTCSVDLLPAGNSTHDALRVEIVSRLLYSTLVSVLQEKTPFDGIVHLESLTQDRDYFNQVVVDYGYAGITFTTIGSLQIATTELFKNGKAVLQKLSLPESFLLTHDNIRLWYCYHCLIMGDCCFQLKECEDGKPWYEAALRVAKFDLTYPETVSHVNADSNAESSMAVKARHNEWKTRAADCHSHIAKMCHNVANYNDAAMHWYDAAKLHDDRTKGEDAQTKGDRALTSLFYSGDAVKALDATKQLLSQTSNLDSNLSMRRAELLTIKGRIEASKGYFDDSILSLKEAQRYYEEKRCLEDPRLVTIKLYLLLVYSRKHDYRTALHVVQGFQEVINRYHQHTMRWFLWEAHKAHIYVDLGEFKTASLILDQIEVPEAKNWKRLEAFVASVRAKLYLCENHRDIESAQDQYDIMEKSLKEVQVRGLPIGPNLPLAGVAHMRSMYLNIDNWNLQDVEKMHDICQQRVVLLRDKAGQEIELARALFRQAVMIHKRLVIMEKWNHQDYEVNKLINEAIQLVETRDRRFLAVLKFAKTVFIQNFDSSTGESEGYDAALIFAELQLNLKDLQTAWISLFELEMMQFFSFMQYISLVHYNNPMKALLWAERGRMRLFMHLTKHDRNTDVLDVEKVTLERVAQQALAHDLEHQKPKFELHGPREQVSSSRESLGKRQGNYQTNQKPLEGLTQVVEGIYNNAKKLNGPDELWFDRDDVLAEKYLLDAVEKCGSGALILEYTVWEKMQSYYIIYAVFIDQQGRLQVKHEILLISDFYSEIRKGKKKWLWGETLKDLIDKTREFISKAKDDLAMEGLSMLHSLLIAPVREYVDKCQRLILAVHDDLALVPFAALYNKRRRKFLVQEKILSYIPSIRVLRYCFHRQTEFEQNMQKKLLGPPFVASNPESMPGWGMKALRRAGEEATRVAQILGVRPYIGLDMTKNAVKNGLSNGSIVLLATHGLVDEFYPHGVLILQDRNSASSDLIGSSSMTQTDVNKDVDATISSDEVASLPGGIRAGLVVLSACETAKGKVTSEGLLGLGRSLLQGGAPTAILTLWEVGDFSSKVLVEGLFQQFVDEGKDAAESLQLTMWQMMNDETNEAKKYSIYQWASMVVLGSPFLKYNSTSLLCSEDMGAAQILSELSL